MNPTDAPAVDLMKLPFKQRNYLLDSAFYDVGSLTSEEQAALSPWVDREGTIIVVSPRTANRDIRHYKNALRFMNKEDKNVRAIAIAGVGSSALGTGALARNVADHYGCDVAGIVTGYGLTDLISEAMGGWFFYGSMDRFRYEMTSIVDGLITTLREARAGTPKRHDKSFAADLMIDSRFVVPGNSDAGTLLDILIAAPDNLSLVVCHSKGCLLTSFVLHHLVGEMGDDVHPYYERLNIVTLGTVVGLPKQFTKCHQFIGKLDWFGDMNSCHGVPRIPIPDAWHHLNTAIPHHLPVAKALKDVAIA